MGVDEIRDYLTHLAVDKNVAASTQNVAFNALLFLYKQVLGIELPAIEGVLRARRPARLPTVFFARVGETHYFAHGKNASPCRKPTLRRRFAANRGDSIAGKRY